VCCAGALSWLRRAAGDPRLALQHHMQLPSINLLTRKGTPKTTSQGRAAIVDHGGVYVAAGKGTVITGEAPHDRVVVLRFGSLDAVKAWFNSPEYQEANKIGQKYAHYNIIAVDGVRPK
jgi:uncharacterized protein (DUF1330 family)